MDRVLLVDDEPDGVEVLGWLLSDWGYEVLKTTSAITGIRLSKTFLPDVLITGYLLGDSLTGLDLIRLLRTERTTLKAILLTGLSRDRAASAEHPWPPDIPVVYKPFSALEIRELLERFTESRSKI